MMVLDQVDELEKGFDRQYRGFDRQFRGFDRQNRGFDRQNRSMKIHHKVGTPTMDQRHCLWKVRFLEPPPLRAP